MRLRQFVYPPNTITPLILGLSCIALFILPLEVHQLLRYDRTFLPEQAWRFISANLLHTNGMHLLLNLIGLALIWALHGRYYSSRGFVSLLLLTSAGTTLGLYLNAPDMMWYVGLSGALHGLFIYGAVMDIRHQEKTGYLLLIGVVLKVADEQWRGASVQVSSLIDAAVAVDAHLFGAISGVVAVLLTLAISNKKAG